MISEKELKNMKNRISPEILCHMCMKDRQVQIDKYGVDQGIDFRFNQSAVWFCSGMCKDDWLEIYRDKIIIPGDQKVE